MPIHIIFDGPPSHESGRFVEVEDDNGKSICIGEWNHTPGKLWELVIPDYKAERDALAEQNRALREALECRTVKGIDDANLDWTVVGILIKHGKTERYIAPGSEAYRIALAALSPPTASPSAPAECPECGGSGRVSLLADDDGGMTTRPCAGPESAATLRAYAKVVEAVAETGADGLSYAHGVTAYVIDEETVMLARKLRGHVDS